jgi:hypothetical protein
MSTAIAIVLAAAAWSGPAAAPAPDAARVVAAAYSASGTHQCRGGDGGTTSCVVTGDFFSTCIDAGSSLKTRDCCPSTRACERDAQGRETNCRRGGTSAGFTLNYCIQGR